MYWGQPETSLVGIYCQIRPMLPLADFSSDVSEKVGTSDPNEIRNCPPNASQLYQTVQWSISMFKFLSYACTAYFDYGWPVCFQSKLLAMSARWSAKCHLYAPPKMKNAPPQTSIIAVRSAYVPSCNATWNTNPDRRTPSFSAVNARQKHMAFAQSEPKQKESAGLLL